MKKLLLLGLLFFVLVPALKAQSLIYPVNDADAIEQSAQHLLFNFLKQQQYKNIRDEKQETDRHYTALVNLQQQVIQQFRQARSVQDLQWADLSKATYLAEELIHGVRSPGLEFDYRVEHPILEQSPAQTYRALFIAGSSDPLPATLQAIQEANHRSKALINSFTQVAAQRKAYAAVAFKYLSEDLKLKASEMNVLLRQPQHFSMTEAERMELQADAEELLERATQTLERSDQLLLEVARTPKALQQATQKQIRQERVELGQAQLFFH